MLEENEVVADRFRLIGRLGRDGMGSAWQAFDARLDTACALAFIEGELANVAEARSSAGSTAVAARPVQPEAPSVNTPVTKPHAPPVPSPAKMAAAAPTVSARKWNPGL